MPEITPHNHLKDNFYSTPQFAHQVMTLKQWKETALATEGRILSCGETWELKWRGMSGGMSEVTVGLTYWKNGKPVRKKGGVK